MSPPITDLSAAQLEELREARVQGAIAVFADKPDNIMTLARAGDILVDELKRIQGRTLTKKQAENALYATCHGCIEPSTKAVLEQLAGVEKKK